MRTFLRPILAVASLALLPITAPASAASNVCISTRDILDQTVQDKGKAILFKMRDGTQWRNTLKGACPDLVFDGFAWTLRDPNQEVCENMQTLRVLHSGQICMLGKFDKVTPAPKRG